MINNNIIVKRKRGGFKKEKCKKSKIPPIKFLIAIF
jgi:hypothetical protein